MLRHANSGCLVEFFLETQIGGRTGFGHGLPAPMTFVVICFTVVVQILTHLSVCVRKGISSLVLKSVYVFFVKHTYFV